MHSSSLLLLVVSAFTLATTVAGQLCLLEQSFVQSKLKDPVYTDKAIACILGEGECTDDLMTRARRKICCFFNN